MLSSVRSTARSVFFIASACVAVACGGAQTDGEATVGDGDPEIERVAQEGEVETPPQLLICGFNKNLSLPLNVVTYLDDDGLSLYDFFHSDAQLVTWMNQHPGGKAYGFRKSEEGGGAKGIGRQVSEPCFGNGDLAKDVIRQVVLVRGGGATAEEALHNILRAGRSVHFLVDRDGTVYEALDPVHAAYSDTDHTDVAVYVALVAPRRLHEWLPDLFRQGAAEGLVGAVTVATDAASDASTMLAPPADLFAERARCSVDGETVESEVYTQEQEVALNALLYALVDEYPKVEMETLMGPDGTMMSGYAEDSLFHAGVLLDYQTREDTREPACLDLERILSQ